MAELPNAWKILNAICALEDADLTHYEIAVMMLLAKYADPGGVNIHPRIKTIATVLRISLSTANRAIGGLRRKGYIETQWQEPGYVAHYRFILAKLGLIDQAEAPASTSKLRKPPRLEAIPPEEDTPDMPDLNRSRPRAGKHLLIIRMESYHRLAARRHPDAIRPDRKEMEEIVETYERLRADTDPEAQKWELAAQYARQELEMMGVLL